MIIIIIARSLCSLIVSELVMIEFIVHKLAQTLWTS